MKKIAAFSLFLCSYSFSYSSATESAIAAPPGLVVAGASNIKNPIAGGASNANNLIATEVSTAKPVKEQEEMDIMFLIAIKCFAYAGLHSWRNNKRDDAQACSVIAAGLTIVHLAYRLGNS